MIRWPRQSSKSILQGFNIPVLTVAFSDASSRFLSPRSTRNISPLHMICACTTSSFCIGLPSLLSKMTWMESIVCIVNITDLNLSKSYGHTTRMKTNSVCPILEIIERALGTATLPSSAGDALKKPSQTANWNCIHPTKVSNLILNLATHQLQGKTLQEYQQHCMQLQAMLHQAPFLAAN